MNKMEQLTTDEEIAVVLQVSVPGSSPVYLKLYLINITKEWLWCQQPSSITH